MFVDTEAYLHYYDGETISSGWERLELVVKFKEEGKFFRTKITETLVSTLNLQNANEMSILFKDYDHYCDEVEKYLNDSSLLERRVEQVIREYFKKKSKNELNDNRSKSIQKRVNDFKSIKVRVKLD
ncbi:hypothetical protein [Brevibacillus porteri]|uniref:hypothetical protein n=1 Tax=Brevibacillus porteri TaxID=2126350 RepID=UPI00364210C8